MFAYIVRLIYSIWFYENIIVCFSKVDQTYTGIHSFFTISCLRVCVPTHDSSIIFFFFLRIREYMAYIDIVRGHYYTHIVQVCLPLAQIELGLGSLVPRAKTKSYNNVRRLQRAISQQWEVTIINRVSRHFQFYFLRRWIIYVCSSNKIASDNNYIASQTTRQKNMKVGRNRATYSKSIVLCKHLI